MALTSTTFKIVTTWQRRSGIPRDAVMNTWHYTSPSAAPSTQDYTNWEQAYKAFLLGIELHLGQSLSILAGDLKIQFYQLPPAPGPVGGQLTGLLHACQRRHAPCTGAPGWSPLGDLRSLDD